MRLLIDTHTFLWFVEGNPKLPTSARQLLEDAGNDVTLSVGSLWEISIKVSLSKLPMQVPLEKLLIGLLPSLAINVLEIRPEHLIRVGVLPLHHRDPSTGSSSRKALEGLLILSADAQFDAYGVQRIW